MQPDRSVIAHERAAGTHNRKQDCNKSQQHTRRTPMRKMLS
jgi:hypothetical protein